MVCSWANADGPAMGQISPVMRAVIGTSSNGPAFDPNGMPHTASASILNAGYSPAGSWVFNGVPDGVWTAVQPGTRNTAVVQPVSWDTSTDYGGGNKGSSGQPTGTTKLSGFAITNGSTWGGLSLVGFCSTYNDFYASTGGIAMTNVPFQSNKYFGAIWANYSDHPIMCRTYTLPLGIANNNGIGTITAAQLAAKSAPIPNLQYTTGWNVLQPGQTNLEVASLSWYDPAAAAWGNPVDGTFTYGMAGISDPQPAPSQPTADISATVNNVPTSSLSVGQTAIITANFHPTTTQPLDPLTSSSIANPTTRTITNAHGRTFTTHGFTDLVSGGVGAYSPISYSFTPTAAGTYTFDATATTAVYSTKTSYASINIVVNNAGTYKDINITATAKPKPEYGAWFTPAPTTVTVRVPSP